MNAGGNGGQGGAGEGSGDGGQQGNPDQITVATSSLATATTMITSTTYPSSASSTPSSSSTATASKDLPEGPIIGGVAGGMAVLLFVVVLIVLCLQGKKKKRKSMVKQEKHSTHSTAEQTSYAGLNSAFSGVPFPHSPSHASLLPPPLFTPNTSPHSGGGMRGGERSPYSSQRHGRETSPYSQRYGGETSPYSEQHGGSSPYSIDRYGAEPSPYAIPRESYADHPSPYPSPRRTSTFETEQFLPTYAESTTSRASLVRINTSQPPPSHNDIVSPMSGHPTNTPQTTISPQTPEENNDETFNAPPGISVPMFLAPQHTRDTMGFPVETIPRRPSFPPPLRSPTRNSYHEIPIATPSPRQLSQQDSLERLVRDGMLTPEPSYRGSEVLRHSGILSQEMMRESPVLGRMYAPPPMRQQSVGGYVVSDEELERLGVGRI